MRFISGVPFRTHINDKVSTKSLEYFGNRICVKVVENDVYCIVLYCIQLQSLFFRLYNDTLFVTIFSSRAEILPL